MTPADRPTFRTAPVEEAVRYYFGYQYELGRSFIAPFLEASGVRLNGARVLEVGSAEGGVLCALAERGAARALGLDIAQVRLESGRIISRHLGLNVEYAAHDIVSHPPAPELREQFDLVILRDVIEHLSDPRAALAHMREAIVPGGMLYITFPPYYSPFGGHQHTLMNRWSGIPYVHLLPEPLFSSVLKGGRPDDIREVRDLRAYRLTIGKIRQALDEAKFSIVREDLYLLRPVFKMKFGLPPIRLNWLRGIPLLRELFSLEASYLVRK